MWRQLEKKLWGRQFPKYFTPNDETESGKELRLVQQYFFVSCSLQDMIRRFKREHGKKLEFFSSESCNSIK